MIIFRHLNIKVRHSALTTYATAQSTRAKLKPDFSKYTQYCQNYWDTCLYMSLILNSTGKEWDIIKVGPPFANSLFRRVDAVLAAKVQAPFTPK